MSLPQIYGSRYYQGERTVRSARDFPLNPSSNVTYFIDGVVDIGDKPINVPSGGLFLKGHNLDLSVLYSSANNYSMFTSAASGSIFINALSIEVVGTGSQVYALVGATGNEAIETDKVNYNNCSSLGYIDNFRQGLETTVGRYGGKPELELRGAWSGFKSTTVNCFGLDADFTGSLFKAGAGLVFSSRFFSNMNCDFPTNARFADFTSANFASPSLLQIVGGIFARDGVVQSGDNDFFPNLNPDDLVSLWKGNQGLRDTFEGGRITLDTEAPTVISATSTFYTLAGTWVVDELQHFSNPSGGQLRNDGTNPIEYRVVANLTIIGAANDAIKVKIRKWDSSESVFVDEYIQPSTINNLSGPRDAAFVSIDYSLNVEKNDYVELQVSNESSISDVTLELGSYFQLQTR